MRRDVLRAPVVHFVLLGALLFAARQLVPEAEPPRQAVRIAAADVARLRAQWPGETQFQAALERHVREEVLVSEAERLGLDRRDPVARERTLANLRFAFPETCADDDTLLRQAAALGLPRRDVVVRRRLAQVMEQRLAGAAEPTAAELAAFVERQTHAAPVLERTDFRQQFFATDAAARAALERLRAGAPAAGEPFALGEEFRGQSSARIARQFGPEFLAALDATPVGEWTGPVTSVYGHHLVHVDARLAAAQPGAPRPALAYALWHEKQRARMQAATAALRASYKVELP